MKMLSITTVDIKKKQKNYPHVVFPGERAFFFALKKGI
ncbi:hypothetical protein B4140_3979 [Bacillus amyloliquefaciens]|nr:hypothetical protein B4140_3979 [Bacillus amyloliquefaciens]